MEDQKLDNLLNLSMASTEEERAKSLNLASGYDPEKNLWDVVVKYSGDIKEFQDEDTRLVPLLGDYAVITLPRERISQLAARQQVEFVEMPKRLYFEVNQGLEAGCFYGTQLDEAGETGMDSGLTGRGVLVGIVDSGVDWRHPDFRNADGSTRILRLWDQTIPADSGTDPPDGYYLGALYTEDDINQALMKSEENSIPSRDISGHGTAVLGIAAGNGRASGGIYRGAAYESSLLVVKLGFPRKDSFPRTSELMQGIDYLIKESRRLRQPLALNLSFGNNYGSHRGDSLLETYLSNAADAGRTSIVVGSGNNGSDGLHAMAEVKQGQVREIEFGVSTREPGLNLQLWKNYADEMDISLIGPSGEQTGPLSERMGAVRYRIGNTELLIYYGKPAPFQVTQEIYFDFIPRNAYVDSGIWKLRLQGRRIRGGKCHLWLPGGKVLNPGTGFYRPDPQETLTIPSTADKVITVGAYDSRYNSFAEFSGRGGSGLSWPKPDFVAPGVNITAPAPGGGYASVTGTSFAAPFAAGAAAILMEYGIIQGHDPFLWGEKVKAYLHRGAQPLPGFEEYPSTEIGWGALCLRASLPQ